jgi:hypothetical protein
MTPEEKLCSRKWRMRNSTGVLWSVLSFGFLTGVGLLIRGVKTKDKRWMGMGVGFLVLGLGLMVATQFFETGTKEAPVTSTASTVWGWIWFLTFVGGIVATFITNRKWLVWRAHKGETKWYAQAGVSSLSASAPQIGYDRNGPAAAFRSIVPASPTPASQNVPHPQTFPSQSGATETIDVNVASAQDLVAVLGIDYTVAGRIVEARHAQGQFTSFEQFMSKAQVLPHLLIPHRHKLVFGDGTSAASQIPPQPNRPSPTQAARRLDL